MKTDTGHYLTVDVSRYQGEIDWQAMRTRSGIQHAYIRVNDGSVGVDPLWRTNAQRALEAGFYVGGYVFVFLTEDPDAMMDRVERELEVVFGPSKRGQLPLMIDVEDNRASAGRLSRARRLAVVERVYQRARVIDDRARPFYTAGWYWFGSRAGSGEAIVEPPWIGVGDYALEPYFTAAYPFQTQGGEPLPGQEWLWETDTREGFYTWGSRAMARVASGSMAGWTYWTLWQFSSIARIPGVDGDCDVNLMSADWADMMTGATEPEPLPSTEDEDMAKLLDLDGTLFLQRGKTVLWIPGRNEWEQRVAANLIGCYGQPSQPDQSVLVPFYLDADSEVPSYPSTWTRYRYELAHTPLGREPRQGSGTGLTEAQVRAIVADELAKVKPELKQASTDGAKAGATAAVNGLQVIETHTLRTAQG